MSHDQVSCGQLAVRLLADYGAEVVFGIPGVHTLEYYRQFASGCPRHVLARHELGAAFMADGYARATGRVGACCVITGPGVTNAATGIAQAYSDSVPLLALASFDTAEAASTHLAQAAEQAATRALNGTR